jgi:glycopeptide antibiotics resistance protein
VTTYLALGCLVVACVAVYAAVTERRLGRGAQFGSVASRDIVLVASVAAILMLTLTPMHHRITGGAHQLQLLPFGDIVGAVLVNDKTKMLEEVSNVLLFIPFGAALRLRSYSLGKSAATAFALSVMVEITQFLIPGRTTSIDDAMLNAAGGVLGYALVSTWLALRGASVRQD